jgi:hypothetical protein
VDACERAFLRAIQQENEEERPGKKGKGLWTFTLFSYIFRS